GSSALRFPKRFAQRAQSHRQTTRLSADFALNRLGQSLIGVGPGWQTDGLDIFERYFGDRLVEVSRPGLSKNPARHFGPGHHGRALRHRIADFEHFSHVRIIDFTEEIPDGS